MLHFVGIEGLFPKIQQADNFTSLTEAVESALGARLNSDLAEATAFAGEILGDFIPTYTEWSRDPISLKTFVKNLVPFIGRTLRETGHWDAYSQSVYRYPDVVLLETTVMLWNKQYPDRKKEEIFISFERNVSKYYFVVDRDDDIARFNTKELRVLIAGVVLDLIRIGSDSRITTEFLKGMAEHVFTQEGVFEGPLEKVQ